MTDSGDLQAAAERDQLWASLRTLAAEVEGLAQGTFRGTERERQLVQLLARIVTAELVYRAEDSKE